MERSAGKESQQGRGGRPFVASAAAGMLAALILLGTTVVQAQSTKRISTRLNASRKTNAPLRFRVNRGEADAAVKYVARAEAYSLFLSTEEVDVMLHRETHPTELLERGKPIVIQAHADVLRMRFANANPPTRIVPIAFEGRGEILSSKAKSGFAGVIYRGVYPGTDVVFHGNQQRMAIDLMLSPGADASGIELEVDGATKITLNAEGNAVLQSGQASFVLERPAFFLARAGLRRPFAGRYELEGHGRLRISGAAAGPSEPVVID